MYSTLKSNSKSPSSKHKTDSRKQKTVHGKQKTVNGKQSADLAPLVDGLRDSVELLEVFGFRILEGRVDLPEIRVVEVHLRVWYGVITYFSSKRFY